MDLIESMDTSELEKDEADDDDDDDGDNDEQEIQKINIALQMNQMLTEQFTWKRQKILKELNDLDFCDNSEDDDKDDNKELLLNQNRKVTQLEKRYSTTLLTTFYKPYLRDNRGFSAPNLFNPEHEYVLESRIQMILHHPCHVRNWTENEKNVILNEVRSQHLFKQTRSIVKRIEELLVLPVRNVEQAEEIKQLNSELALKRLSHEEPERFCSNIDWLAIAKLCENEDRNDDDCELYYNNYLHSSVNRQEWTEEEDVKLKELIEKYGENDWDRVAVEIHTGRLPWQCCSRYQSRHSKSLHMTGPIDDAEAKKLLRLIEQARTDGGEVDWKYVSRIEEGRLLPQIKYFYQQHLLESSELKLKKYTRWTRLEDTILFAAHKYYKNDNNDDKHDCIYVKIAKHLPGRTNRQIRERYTMILSQQRQQKGYWKQSEDLALLNACAKDLLENGKIDYVRLNRNLFPLRNPHRIFHRFRLLSRYLPEDFYHQPINNKLLDCLHPVKTKRFAMKQIYRPKLPKNRQKLFNYLRKLSNIQQMIMEGKQIEYNFDDDKNDEDFISDNDSDNDVVDVDIVQQPQQQQTTKTNKINLPTALTVLTKPNDKNDEQQWTIDSCIQLYKHLKPLAGFFQRRCIYDTNGDICLTDMLRTILRELLDTDIVTDICRGTSSSSSLINQCNNNNMNLENNDQYDHNNVNNVNPLSLDTIRFYLASTSVSINQQQQQQQSNNIRSLFLPNYSTTYAYVLMQFLYNAMFIHSVECQYNINDNNIDNINGQLEYQKLRSIFISLFLWPALLSRLRPDTDCNDKQLQEILISNQQQQKNNNNNNVINSMNIELQKNSDESGLMIKLCRKRGRKPKRQFRHENLDKFLRIRSMQNRIFKNPNYESEQVSPSSSSSSPLLWFQQKNFKKLITEKVTEFLEKISKQIDDEWSRRQKEKELLLEEKKNNKSCSKIVVHKRRARSIDNDDNDDNDNPISNKPNIVRRRSQRISSSSQQQS